MPFTPLHFGPSVLLGRCFGKRIDLPALLLANVAVDLEPLIASSFDLGVPEHGLSHSLPGASLIAAAWAFLYFKGSKWFGRAVERGKVFVSSFLGGVSNAFIDAFAYQEVMPFYPLPFNPFYGIISERMLTAACGTITAGWLSLVLIRLLLKTSHHRS